MFLDKFEAKTTAIDDKPLKPGEEGYTFTLWSSGKVERSLKGKSEEVPKDDIEKFIAQLAVYYGITPKEFEDGLEAEQQNRAAGDQTRAAADRARRQAE